MFSFETRVRGCLCARRCKQVIARHDILRTAVMWEGLPEPVQVVWRERLLTAEELELDPAAGDIAAQLRDRFDPRHYRLDVRQAPMWQLFVAEDAAMSLGGARSMHHLIGGSYDAAGDAAGNSGAFCAGGRDLPPPVPFRNFVAQARLGVSRTEHEAFFSGLLADVDEPTAPFGLLDVQGTARHRGSHRKWRTD